MTPSRLRRLLRSLAVGLAITLLGILGAAYLSTVDRGPEWLRWTAKALAVGLAPFWWTCATFAWRLHGPNAWLLAGAILVNVVAWTLVGHAAAAVLRRARLR